MNEMIFAEMRIILTYSEFSLLDVDALCIYNIYIYSLACVRFHFVLALDTCVLHSVRLA